MSNTTMDGTILPEGWGDGFKDPTADLMIEVADLRKRLAEAEKVLGDLVAAAKDSGILTAIYMSKYKHDPNEERLFGAIFTAQALLKGGE